jgi:hypothetical protein
MSGGSQKSFVDALRVFEVQAKGLDRVYLDDWAKSLGVLDLWKRLQSEAELLSARRHLPDLTWAPKQNGYTGPTHIDVADESNHTEELRIGGRSVRGRGA